MSDYVLGTILTFTDGGAPEGQLMHRGTEESCVELAKMLPAISYSGDRPVEEARIVWMPVGESIWELPEPAHKSEDEINAR